MPDAGSIAVGREQLPRDLGQLHQRDDEAERIVRGRERLVEDIQETRVQLLRTEAAASARLFGWHYGHSEDNGGEKRSARF